MEDLRREIESLVEKLNVYAKEYYTLDAPSISDKEYDALYDRLVALEKETGYQLPYSPTQRVGDEVLSAMPKHRHLAKLWSLDKAQSLVELLQWHERNLSFVEEYNKDHENRLPPV